MPKQRVNKVTKERTCKLGGINLILLGDSLISENGTTGIEQDIEAIRNEICDWTMIISSFVALPALFISLYNATEINLETSMISEIIIAISLWIITYFRRKISYQGKATSLLLILFSLSVFSYISFGIMGAGNIWMLTFSIFSAVFFGTKTAIVAICIGTITTLGIGGVFVFELNTLKLNSDEYNQNFNYWLSSAITFILLGAATAGAVLRLNLAQSKLVTRLHNQSVELKFSQSDLERKVEQKTRELSLEVIQRKAQAFELQKGEERFRAFTEAITDRVWEMDENARYTYVSSPSGNLTKSTEDLIGRTPWEVEGVEATPATWQSLRKLFAAHEPFRNLRFQYKKTKDEVVYAAHFGVPNFDSANKFIGYRGTTQDQTNDEVLRRKAQSIENRFFNSIAKLHAGFALWDKDARLVMCNDFFRNTHKDTSDLLRPGVSFKAIATARAYSKFNVSSKGREEQWIDERIKSFQQPNSNNLFKSGDRWIESHTYQIEDGSKIIFQVDVTDQRQMESIKSDFVSLVSHELRTPLTSIYGSLSLLKNAGETINASTSKDLITVAERNSERLLSLVNDILDLQKIVAGKLELNIEPIDLKSVIAETIEDNKAFGEKYDIKLLFSHDNKNIVINGDPLRIKQVLTNLLSNAAKFSPSGNTVEITLEQSANRAVIAVKDNGPGIAEEFHQKIFDPFVQIADVDTREIGGTGLGLPITKALVQQQKGSIYLSSEIGKGSTFSVEFPFN